MKAISNGIVEAECLNTGLQRCVYIERRDWVKRYRGIKEVMRRIEKEHAEESKLQTDA